MRRPDSKRGAGDRLGTTVTLAILVVLSALLSGLLARSRQVTRSSTSITDDTPIKQLGEVLFHSDSVESSTSTELGKLGGGLFLNSNLFVYADALARTLNFVHVDRREIVTVGGHGQGPGEFQVVGGVFRDGQGNVVVDDWAALRATVLDPDGNAIRTIAYDVSPLTGGPGVPRVVGLTTTGTLIVRDSDPWVVPRPDGLYRPNIWLVTLDVASRSSLTIVHGKGRESVRMNRNADDAHSFSFSTVDVPFAHDLFSVFHDDKLYVADTSKDSAVVVNTAGTVVRRIPLPPARIASEEDLASWKEQQTTRLRERNSSPSSFDASDHIRWTREATGNTVAPRISGMFVDVAGRLWMQRYAMPTDTAAYWEQWDLNDQVLSAVVSVPPGDQLLDAAGAAVLTSSTTELGLTSITVWRLAGES